MSKVKVKKIKVPIGMKDEGLAEMFNQMLGAGSVNMTIAYPRYLRIKGLCVDLVNLFDILAKSPFLKAYKEFSKQKQEVEEFCEWARKRIDELFKIDFSDYEWNLTLVEDELKKKFTSEYEEMKKADLINKFVIMCDKLVPYKKNFVDFNNLNHKFITCMAGAEFEPFPFTTLNLRYIFGLSGVGENTIRFFMALLNKAFTLSHRLWEETVSPDIDVDQFVNVIMANISEIEKRPELSRCKKAFQKIRESVGMLKEKFSGYYRDFINTKDSTIMMQHFILDISENTKTDPQVVGQFNTIIAYYRKLASNQITNPKIKMLFDKVNDSFKNLERGTENLVKIRDDVSSGDDEDAAQPDASTSGPTLSASALSAADLVKK